MTLTRRSFLQGAALGAAVAALPRTRPARAAIRTAEPAKNVILLLAAGGWDVTYALDPKPGLATVDAPPGTLSRYGDLSIWTNPTRPGVAAFFEAHAGVTAVVNGLTVRSIAHRQCRKLVLTGTPSAANPDIGAICAHDTGAELPLPYLVLGDNAITGPLAASAGRVGSRKQLVALLDDSQAFDGPPGSGFVPDADDQAAVRAWVDARLERERAQRGAFGANRRLVDDFSGSLERGDLLREHAAGFGRRGGATSLAAQLGLATDVIQQGISRATMIDSRLDWDTHTQNDDQDGFHDTIFAALRGLVDDLATRPGRAAGKKMLDETVVVVLSELSRTPKLNGQGGKDHWPVTSAMVIGGGVRGGRAYGATSDKLEARPIDLATGEVGGDGGTLQTSQLTAGVVALAGGDPEKWFPGVEALRAFIA